MVNKHPRKTIVAGLAALLGAGGIGAAALSSSDETRAEVLPANSTQPVSPPAPGENSPSAVDAVAPMSLTVRVTNLTDIDFRLWYTDRGGIGAHWQQRPLDVLTHHTEQEWTMYATSSPGMLVQYFNAAPDTTDSFHIRASVPAIGENQVEAAVFDSGAYVITCSGDSGWHPTFTYQIVDNAPGVVPCARG